MTLVHVSTCIYIQYDLDVLVLNPSQTNAKKASINDIVGNIALIWDNIALVRCNIYVLISSQLAVDSRDSKPYISTFCCMEIAWKYLAKIPLFGSNAVISAT